MFPEIREIPCESKLECFALINWTIQWFKDHAFMLVSDMYEHLELEPIPEEAYHYCWLTPSDFMLHKAESQYYLVTKDPIEIVD